MKRVRGNRPSIHEVIEMIKEIDELDIPLFIKKNY